jgi:acyl dehydratase
LPKLFWEDFVPGAVFEHGPRRVTRDEIVAFAAEFDPQPMHLDDAAAQASMLGGLAASGWHVCSLLMKMATESFVLDSSSMGAPGVEEVRWRVPVRPGDDLTLRTTVVETRASSSRPHMGLVTLAMEMRKASGEVAMTLRTTLMMGRRPAS